MRDISGKAAGALALAAMALTPIPAQAFDAGGFAGGILGGMIGSAMMRSQPRPVVIYRPRHVYRVVVPRRVVVQRHYAAAARPAHQARHSAPTASAAVVNTSADPFAAAKPAGPMPIPVANKP